ncbi:MAG: hypothetical protein JW895_15300 [Thermoleophilaceae bacterium]|nr:hypothetical protein [Thermoleophilaceae bacterium]
MTRLALAAGALLLAAGSACGDDAQRPTYPAVTGDPALTSKQRRTALRIMRSDRRLRRALAGNPLRVAQLGPWLSADHRLIGAAAVLPLRAQRSYPMREWPLIDGDPPYDLAYDVSETPVRYTGVTELLVEVDLKLRRLVGINPGGDDLRGEYGPGVELREPTGE